MSAEDADARATALAGLLRKGLEALKAGRAGEAATALEAVATDPELAEAADLRDIRARACTLLAQALLDEGRLADAGLWLDVAGGLLQADGEDAGLEVVRELSARRRDLLADRARHSAVERQLQLLAETPLDEIRARYADQPVALQEALVRKANAEIEAGRHSAGAAIAEEAVELARRTWSVRGEVLALLSLARAHPASAPASLTTAWRVAERADEFNLVGAVARAAEAAGVGLPETVVPTGGASLRS